MQPFGHVADRADDRALDDQEYDAATDENNDGRDDQVEHALRAGGGGGGGEPLIQLVGGGGRQRGELLAGLFGGGGKRLGFAPCRFAGGVVAAHAGEHLFAHPVEGRELAAE